jgi:SAM-dependent methyltransferase
MAPKGERWNHNLHYHRVILDAVPSGCESALDVGCGEGTLARQLRRLVPHVTGIDLDQASIDLARRNPDTGDVDYIDGDFLTHRFEPALFDLVASVASLHHMEAGPALERMRDLLRPGGVLAVVGLARAEYPADLPLDLTAAVVSRMRRLSRGWWEHPSPVAWPPPETFHGMEDLAAVILPGVRYRRHLLWRYSLVWVKNS